MIEVEPVGDSLATCISCGQIDDVDSLRWIIFKHNNSKYYERVCLCKVCSLELSVKLTTNNFTSNYDY